METRGHAEHELFRYTRGIELRIYVLRVGAGATELWRITHAAGQPVRSVLETAFSGSAEAAAFIEEVERTLTAGGWRPVEE